MSLSSVLPHFDNSLMPIGYAEVDLDPRGPFIGYNRTEEIDQHTCFTDFERYLKTMIINSSIIIGSGTTYLEGMIMSPFPQCPHYRIMIFGIAKERYKPVESHDDYLILVLIIPVELFYNPVPYLDLEMEITALVQQKYDQIAEDELYEQILHYLQWKFS